MGSSSEWLRQLAIDPVQDNNQPQNYSETFQGNENASLDGDGIPGTADEVKTKEQTIEILKRLQGRLGGVPSGLTFEQLDFLDQTLQRLDQNGAATLGPTEQAVLYLCPQTASIAQENGIPMPPDSTPQNSGELKSVALFLAQIEAEHELKRLKEEKLEGERLQDPAGMTLKERAEYQLQEGREDAHQRRVIAEDMRQLEKGLEMDRKTSHLNFIDRHQYKKLEEDRSSIQSAQQFVTGVTAIAGGAALISAGIPLAAGVALAGVAIKLGLFREDNAIQDAQNQIQSAPSHTRSTFNM